MATGGSQATIVTIDSAAAQANAGVPLRPIAPVPGAGASAVDQPLLAQAPPQDTKPADITPATAEAPFSWMADDPEFRAKEPELDPDDDEDGPEEPLFPWWTKLSTFEQWIICNAVILAILLIIGLVSKLGFQDSGAQINNVDLSLWCLFIGITVVTLSLCRMGVWFVLAMWKKTVRRLRNVERVQLVESLQGWITVAIWSLINFGLYWWVVVAQVCKDDTKAGSNCQRNTISNIFLSLVFSSLAFFFKSYAFHSFVRSFHQVAYQERLNKLKFADYVFSTLRDARRHAKAGKPVSHNLLDQTTAAGARVKGTASEPSDPNRPPVNLQPPNPSLSSGIAKVPGKATRPLYQTFAEPIQYAYDVVVRRALFDVGLGTAKQAINLGTKVTGVVANELIDGATGANKGDDGREEALTFARKIFEWLCPDERIKPVITPADFAPIFPKPSLAKRAFDVFDRDHQGSITNREMKLTVLEIFDEHRAISKSIHDMHHALTKLNLTLTIMTVFFLIWIWLLVFGVDLTSVMVNLTSLLVLSSYVIGNSFKDMFTCILFLFVIHPYDVGDNVNIGGQDGTFTVLEMNILTTTFRRGDGTVFVVSNIILYGAYITNIRRSAPQWHGVTIDVSPPTDMAVIDRFREKLNEFVKENNVEFESGSVTMADMDGIRYMMRLSVGVQHRVNFQDGGKMVARKNKFLTFVKQTCAELGIQPVPAPSKQLVAFGDSNFAKSFETAFGGSR